MIGIVSYSSSDSEEKKEEEDVTSKFSKRKVKSKLRPTNKKARPLSLPDSVANMFPDKVKKGTNNAEKHEGRVRSFAHFEGNWPSYVYTPLPENPYTCALYDEVKSKMKGLNLKFFPLKDCHISLSRTVPVRHYWIAPIFEKLNKSLACKCCFNFSLSRLKLYENDERTRTFVGVETSLGDSDFKDIVTCVDEVFEEFGLAKYYGVPSFHASLAWCVGSRKTELDAFVAKMKPLQNICTVSAAQVCLKTGNKTMQISLA